MRQFRPRGLSQSWWKLEIRWNFELEAESSVRRPEWWSEHNTATEHGILRSQSPSKNGSRQRTWGCEGSCGNVRTTTIGRPLNDGDLAVANSSQCRAGVQVAWAPETPWARPSAGPPAVTRACWGLGSEGQPLQALVPRRSPPVFCHRE